MFHSASLCFDRSARREGSSTGPAGRFDLKASNLVASGTFAPGVALSKVREELLDLLQGVSQSKWIEQLFSVFGQVQSKAGKKTGWTLANSKFMSHSHTWQAQVEPKSTKVLQFRLINLSPDIAF